ncbi:ATP-binding protein [Mycetocola zhujimingii]|uniref:ATP-binding protein n=1 Tax=Mycetocola zhujimingii TaxID=2079792 RepID=UPI000D344094|nr:sensor histidine kinase [Mycetocola zhujimingii]AWB87933.1 sensor histidine kinase [Mycetocola zhujimingii]
MSLRLQLLLLQALIVCSVVLVTGVVAAGLFERQVRDAYLDRMIGVAQSVATLPAIRDAYDDQDPAAVIQPIAEVIREASNVTYVVVTDADGIRYSHPDTDRIGEPVSTDPSVPLSGKMFVGTETGTLGESWRAKVPVHSADGEVIGTVSVGILESALREDFVGGLGALVFPLAASAVVGIFGAAGVTAIIRRRIYRLEPKEIASLVGSRETMLHGMSEGMISVDEAGVIVLVNDAALELLGLEEDSLTGRVAAEVLDPSLVGVLQRGEPGGQLVLAGERILVARSTGTELHGRAVGATLLVRDHTELHQLLGEMDGAQSLTNGLRAQAHEFANKLHVISGLLELGLIDDARAFVERTGTGGALRVPGEEVILEIPELAALLLVKASHARELGMSVSILPTDPLPAWLRSDAASTLRGDLVTVVGNLIDNALEACSAGNHIELGFGIDGARIRVTVQDDGDGIPPDQYERVFEEGVSSKAIAADASPTLRRRGIGLALVRRTVLRARGTVTVGRSERGGALFTVELPVGDLPERGRPSRESAAGAGAAGAISAGAS